MERVIGILNQALNDLRPGEAPILSKSGGARAI